MLPGQMPPNITWTMLWRRLSTTASTPQPRTDQLRKLLSTAHLAHAATRDVERCLTDIDRAQKRLDDLVKECSNNLLFDSSSGSDWRSRLQQMANRSYTILCAAMDIDVKPLEDATAAVQAAILRLPAADELHWQVCGDAEGYAKPGTADQVVEELMKEHPSNVYVSGQPGMGKSRLTKYIQVCSMHKPMSHGIKP